MLRIYDAHIGLIADWKSGEPKVLELQKCDGWGWYDLDAVPKGSFWTTWLGIDAYRTGMNYYEREALHEYRRDDEARISRALP